MWMHLLLSLVANTMLGMLWYSPLMFGSPWMRIAHPGKRPEDMGGGRAIATSWIGGGIVASGIYFISRVFLKINSLEGAMRIASWIAAIVCGSQICHVAFEQKPIKFYLINQGYDTVCIFMSAALLHFVA